MNEIIKKIKNFLSFEPTLEEYNLYMLPHMLECALMAKYQNNQIKNALEFDETNLNLLDEIVLIYKPHMIEYNKILSILKSSYKKMNFNEFYLYPFYDHYCSAIIFDKNFKDIGDIFLNNTNNIIIKIDKNSLIDLKTIINSIINYETDEEKYIRENYNKSLENVYKTYNNDDVNFSSMLEKLKIEKPMSFNTNNSKADIIKVIYTPNVYDIFIDVKFLKYFTIPEKIANIHFFKDKIIINNVDEKYINELNDILNNFYK